MYMCSCAHLHSYNQTRGLLSPASQSLRASVRGRGVGGQKSRNEKKPLFGAMRKSGADPAGECSYRRLESPRWGPMAAHEALSEARERSERRALQQHDHHHPSLSARSGADISVAENPSTSSGVPSSSVGGLVVKEEEKEEMDKVEANIFMDANFWRVVVFTACVLFTSQQWRYQDLILPK